MAIWKKIAKNDANLGRWESYECSCCHKFSCLSLEMALSIKECPNCGAWLTAPAVEEGGCDAVN